MTTQTRDGWKYGKGGMKVCLEYIYIYIYLYMGGYDFIIYFYYLFPKPGINY